MESSLNTQNYNDGVPTSAMDGVYVPLKSANDNEKPADDNRNNHGSSVTHKAASAARTGGIATQATGKTINVAGKGVSAAGRGAVRAGAALTETGIGAVVGVPLAAVGGVATAGGRGMSAVGKGMDTAGRSVRRAGRRVSRSPIRKPLPLRISNRMREKRGQMLKSAFKKLSGQKQEKSKKKLSGMAFWFVVVLAIVKDVLDIILTGTVILMVLLLPISLFVTTAIGFYYFYNNVKLDTRKMATFIITILIEMLPLLGIIPSTTLSLFVVRKLENGGFKKARFLSLRAVGNFNS